MAAGVIFALLTGYVMDKVDLPGVDWLLSFYLVALLFTGFAMGGVANAINIIDGFNGLAAGSLIDHVRRLRLRRAPGGRRPGLRAGDPLRARWSSASSW